MKQIVALAVVAALASPAAAQESSKQEGLSLMERGAEMILRELMDDIEPTLDEFRDFAEQVGPKMQEMILQMGPAFQEMLDKIDDIGNYSAPEFLPNGDIIIRRKPDAPVFTPLPEGSVDL